MNVWTSHCEEVTQHLLNLWQYSKKCKLENGNDGCVFSVRMVEYYSPYGALFGKTELSVLISEMSSNWRNTEEYRLDSKNQEKGT